MTQRHIMLSGGKRIGSWWITKNTYNCFLNVLRTKYSDICPSLLDGMTFFLVFFFIFSSNVPEKVAMQKCKKLCWITSCLCFLVQVTKWSRKLERAHFQRCWKLRALKMGSSTHAKLWSRRLTGYVMCIESCPAQSVVHMYNSLLLDP